jgi:hypothetical protein
VTASLSSTMLTAISVSEILLVTGGIQLNCITVEIFIHWLCTQRLPAKYSLWLKKDEVKPGTKGVQMTMLDTWIFADRFLISELRRDCEHALIDNFSNHSLPYYEVVISAYEHLPSTSPVLKAMIATHCERFGKDADNDDNGEINLRTQLPNAFLVGVMMQYVILKGHGWGTSPDPRQFHDHPQEGWACIVNNLECANDLAHDSSKRKESSWIATTWGSGFSSDI